MYSIERYKVRRCDACSTQIGNSVAAKPEEDFIEDTSSCFCASCSKKIIDRMSYKNVSFEDAKQEVINNGKFEVDLNKRNIMLC